jgi:hypothetical protein
MESLMPRFCLATKVCDWLLGYLVQEYHAVVSTLLKCWCGHLGIDEAVDCVLTMFRALNDSWEFRLHEFHVQYVS